jgi:cytochrome d ubiquinol oxidase subunit I
MQLAGPAGYGTLAVIEVRLMLAAIRHGPIEDHNDSSADQSLHQGYAPLPAE